MLSFNFSIVYYRFSSLCFLAFSSLSHYRNGPVIWLTGLGAVPNDCYPEKARMLDFNIAGNRITGPSLNIHASFALAFKTKHFSVYKRLLSKRLFFIVRRVLSPHRLYPWQWRGSGSGSTFQPKPDQIRSRIWGSIKWPRSTGWASRSSFIDMSI